MKTKPLFAIALLLAVSCFSAQAQEPAYEKYSKVKFYPPRDLTARNNLLGSLEIDHFSPSTDGAIIATISAHALHHLQSSGSSYEVLVDDVSKHFREESKKFFEKAKKDGVEAATSEYAPMARTAFEKACQSVQAFMPTPSLFSSNGLPQGSMGGFFTYTEMVAKIDQVVSMFPTMVQKINLGMSHQSRVIWAVKISDNVTTDENEPEVLYTGLQHAREAITGTSLIFFMQYLLQNYASNPQVKALVDSREIFIIPCTNPDGYSYNQQTDPTGGGMWRKNRRNNGSSYGVDMNRNYGVDWGNCSGASSSCGSTSPTSDTYFGPSVFSEPETRAIRDFVYSRKFVTAIDQHCTGPYYSLPFGRPSLHTMSALDQKFYTYVPALMGKFNGHRAGNSPQTVNYEVAGGIKDWLLMGDIGVGSGPKGKIYGMTGEAGSGMTTGEDFWAPSSQIINLCKGLVFQDLQLALIAGSYFDFQDINDLNITSRSGNFEFSLRRVGLQNAPATVSLIPLENIMWSGPPVTINSFPNYYDSVKRRIPYLLGNNLGNGQRVSFVWRVESGGITIYDTVSKIFNALPLIVDDMETGAATTSWTINPAPPTGSYNTTWGYTTSSAFAGSRSFAESPTGNYAAGSTRTAQYRTNLDLTGATAAYLSFWVRHKAENFRDKLRVQVARGNAPTTWITLCGKNTVQGNNVDGGTLSDQAALTGIREEWTREHFDLTAFSGENALRFRLEFTSSSTDDNFDFSVDDGFYIDNLKVVKTMSSLVNLPVQFVDVKGRLLHDRTIEVTWLAYADDMHDYFEVEKSANGSDFYPIGVVKGPPPYKHIDKTPLSGNNFYRIKQYDKDGKFSHSKTINVVYNPGVKLIIYPNPVTANDALTIKLLEGITESLNIRITDVQGRVVYEKVVNDLPSTSELKIPAGTWTPQVYVLKITNTKGEFITVQKFVKQ